MKYTGYCIAVSPAQLSARAASLPNSTEILWSCGLEATMLLGLILEWLCPCGDGFPGLDWERLVLCGDFPRAGRLWQSPKAASPWLVFWSGSAKEMWWRKLSERHLDSLGMEKAGYKLLLLCWSGMLSVQVRWWFWCFFVFFNSRNKYWQK